MKRLRFILLMMVAAVMLPVSADNVVTNGTGARIVVNVDSIESARNPTPSLCRTLSAEFGGASLGPVSLNYDSRFRPGSVFGYRVGLGFTNGTCSDSFGNDHLGFRGVSVPLEVNAIMGKKKSKFELGLGIVPSILRRDVYSWEYSVSEGEDGYIHYDIFRNLDKRGTHLNIMGFMNIGYRYQRQSGFFMRVGFSFLIGDFKYSPVDGVLLSPYIAFGYTI